MTNLYTEPVIPGGIQINNINEDQIVAESQNKKYFAMKAEAYTLSNKGMMKGWLILSRETDKDDEGVIFGFIWAGSDKLEHATTFNYRFPDYIGDITVGNLVIDRTKSCVHYFNNTERFRSYKDGIQDIRTFFMSSKGKGWQKK